MHRCLHLDEILGLIFDHITISTYETKNALDGPTLLAFLKTCRSISVPAAARLWRSLPSFAPLLLTMPENLVEIEEHGEQPFTPRTVTFRRDTLPGDWDRFDFYAPFVREIGVIGKNGRSMAKYLVLDEKIFRELKMRNGILLSNLETTVIFSNDLPLTPLLLDSPVQRIQFILHPAFIPTIIQIADECSCRATIRLKSLHINGSTSWAPIMKSLIAPAISTLLSIVDVEEFVCNWYPLSGETMERLIRMPRLRKLGIFQKIPSLAQLLATSPIGEPRLQEVTIWTDFSSPSHLPQILANLKPSRLETFCHIYASASGRLSTESEIQGIISAVQKYCSPKHLTQFSLETEDVQFDVAPAATIDIKILRPMFSFSKLRRLDLIDHPLDLNDDEVKELAQSWPMLEVLEVKASFVENLEPKTTIRCLLWLAIYCRNLSSLSFVFNGTDTFSDEELSMASGNPLSSLSVGCSTISEPEKVSAFLTLVFPELSLLHWDDTPDAVLAGNPNRSEMWRQVEDGIQL
ncbi:hypothetical protein BDN70DRAFT_989764 [Pholiota conissans]|uniref:F-box domain-containing protein n=1 Tax=Pholiota conissans TaxID=109636 RepID=A0A9P6D598_9AGAR|nr:hypothetical protein BDN70DRAFT_989764 [Pholiota conissans]